MSPDRALSPAQKWEVMDRLLRCWLLSHELRLGQLLENAHGLYGQDIRPEDLRLVEDYALVRQVEEMVSR